LDPLARAWLEELNLLHRLADDLVAHEREKILAKAHAAADRVRSHFSKLKSAGELKRMCSAYRKFRLSKQGRVQPWPRVVLRLQTNVVRAMAREQASRARRGIAG
jgi:hypothetical protein